MVLQMLFQFNGAPFRQICIAKNGDNVIPWGKDCVFGFSIIDQLSEINGMDKRNKFGAVESKEIFFSSQLESTRRNEERGNKVENTVRCVDVGLNQIRTIDLYTPWCNNNS